MFASNADIPKAGVLIIGNEIITGLVQDTNSATICERLNMIGIDVARIISVGDDEASIKRALSESLQAAEIVIVTGGLGATHDDITKEVLARFFNSEMAPDEKVRGMVEKFFKSRGREVPEYALSQCEAPQKADILYNDIGTAPGLLFQQEGKMVFALPGIPVEMDYLLEQQVLPRLASKSGVRIAHRALNTTGITESGLWEKVGPLDALKDSVVVASLPSHLGVRIRLSAYGKEESEAMEKLNRAEKFFREKISSYIYGLDEETLEGNLGQLLREKKLTLAVAESCTGGLIGHRLTNISGSSDYYLEGFVTYSNEAKARRLGVEMKLIEKHGAVSLDVALAMAEGVRKAAGADRGLAVTGIAGPTGGTESKPVGLTFIAVSDKERSQCERFLFPQDRIRNKERAAQAALNLLRLSLIH
ncbi:MAG: competence/damage-inducible protein A [Nitrospinae bacterium]|nr:competence/damage-inducible protein A [Nitrospinota bacterium]